MTKAVLTSLYSWFNCRTISFLLALASATFAGVGHSPWAEAVVIFPANISLSLPIKKGAIRAKTKGISLSLRILINFLTNNFKPALVGFKD